MNFKKMFERGTAILATSIVLNATEVKGQSPQTLDQNQIQDSHIEHKADQNMPTGFKRDYIVGSMNGQEKIVASLFYFEEGKTKVEFLSNDLHPEAFSPEINYDKIRRIVESKGNDFVIAFAGAYKSPSNNIEGIALEEGISVGEQNFSKWSGFVYITPDGNIELHRLKDAQENFDKNAAQNLIQKAEQEQGSLFQQIPAVWNGEKKMTSSSQDKFEYRAICETKDGKKFVLNCSEKITLNDFLDMALNLKSENGEQLIKTLMLEDTGVYSYGVFEDKDGKEYKMVDENYANNKTGYTNVVVISK